MLNQLVSEKKEKLVPYVNASFMIPFRLTVSTSIAKDKILLSIFNGEDAIVRIKRISLNCAPFLNDNVKPGFFVISKFTASEMISGDTLIPAKKDSLMSDSKLLHAAYVTGHEDGVIYDNLNNIQPIGYNSYRRIQSNVPVPFEWDVRKCLDFKDHIMLNNLEGLMITQSDANDIGALTEDEIFGVIEWDEVFL